MTRCNVCAIALLALVGVSAGLLESLTKPAAAQSLSPYGMWSDRDREFRGRRYELEQRRYEREQRRYERQLRYEQRYGARYRDDYFDDDYFERDPYRSNRAGRPGQFELSDDVLDGGARPVITARAPPLVPYSGNHTPGSIIIDVGGHKLYYITSATQAYAYPIGVGRDGFSWTGSETVSRIAEWPDWFPPAEMRQRQPELPAKMLGGLKNPLGAKAIYLGSTLYRIHGTNDPKSIGQSKSSGCFRMMNENVVHLASLVQVGAQVSVVSSLAVADAAIAKRAAAQPSNVNPPASDLYSAQQGGADDDRDNFGDDASDNVAPTAPDDGNDNVIVR